MASVEGATLTALSIKATMQDLVLDTTAVISFQNKHAASIEASFSFRSEATVYYFAVEVNGKKTVAQCKEKVAALNDYDDGISGGGRGFLMAKKKSDKFNLALGNLASGDSGTLTLQFVEEVALDDAGSAIVEVPLVRLAPAKGLTECEIRVLAPDVTGVTVPSEHSVQQKKEADGVTVSVTGNNGMQRDLRLVVAFEESGLPFPTVERDGNTTALAISFVPHIVLGAEDDPMTEVVFLIDRSGSMSGARLRQVKAALQLMLRSFPAGSTFDLVSFGSKYESLFGAPVEYDEKTFVRASEAVEAFEANMGGTKLLEPLREILSRPASKYPRQVVLLTDGEVDNTAAVISMTAEHGENARVFALGIGSDASPDLIKGVAKAGRGHSDMAASGERLEPLIASLCNRVFRPVIRKVAMDWGDLSKSMRFQTPATQGVVFAGQKLSNYAVLFENDGAKHQVSLTVELTGGQSKKYIAQVDLGQAKAGQTAHRLAVSSLVADYEAKLAPKDLTKADIVALACKYGVVSSLTSLVAVDMSDDRAAPDALVQVKVGQGVRDSFGDRAPTKDFIPLLDDDSAKFKTSSKSLKKGGGGFFSGIAQSVSSLFSSSSAPDEVVGGPPPPPSASLYQDDEIAEIEARMGKLRSIAINLDDEIKSSTKAIQAVNQKVDLSMARVQKQNSRVEKILRSRSPSPTADSVNKKASPVGRGSAPAPSPNSPPARVTANGPVASSSARRCTVQREEKEAEAVSMSKDKKGEDRPMMRGRFSSQHQDDEEDDDCGLDLFGSAAPQQQQQQQPQPQAPPKQTAPKKVDANARPLDVLTRLAGFDGLFALNEELANALGKPWASIAQSPEGVPEKVWATALAMASLQLRFAELKVEWEMLFGKCVKALLRLKCNYENIAPRALAILK